jgi:hypothetical protein
MKSLLGQEQKDEQVKFWSCNLSRQLAFCVTGVDTSGRITRETDVQSMRFILFFRTVKIKVKLRSTMSRPVRLGVGRLSGTRDHKSVYFIDTNYIRGNPKDVY